MLAPRQLAGLYLVTWALSLNDSAAVKPEFGRPLNNLTVSKGREAIFICIVENLGTYKVAFLRVDTQTILTISSHVITKNHRIAVTHSGHRTWSLHIRETRENDGGWYMCQVNTEPMSHVQGYLQVVVPPDILDYPTSTDMMVREGSNVTLRCVATGTPEPSVTWRREFGQHINTTKRREAVTSLESRELAIVRVNRAHMGAYLCIASNGVPPSVSKRILLIVHFPPMLRIENQLVGAYEGENLALECRAEAFPQPITYWTTPHNETINNDKHYKVEAKTSGYETIMKLTIRSVRDQDFGPFRCIATNSLGETDGKIKLYRISSAQRPNSRRESKKPRNREPGQAKLGESATRDGEEDEEDLAEEDYSGGAVLSACLSSRLLHTLALVAARLLSS